MAQKGLIDNLIIFETSRISRNFIEGQTVVDTLTKCNVKIHCVTDNAIINESELNQLMNAFKFFFNQKASKETGVRVRSAHQLLRSQGKWPAGSLPIGFKLVDGFAIIDEELAPQITAMFEDYINYSSKFTQKKYQIKNRKTLIERISHPMLKQIVGEDLWLRANRVRESRKCRADSSANQLNRTDILFEGLLYHKVCGSKLYVNRDYRSKKQPHNYRCKYCRGNEAITTKKSFSGRKLDSYLEQQILHVLDNLNHDALVEKYASRCTKKLAVLQLKQRELINLRSSKMRALQLAQTKLEGYILNDAPDSTINAVSNMIQNNNEELVRLEEQLTKLNNELDALQEQAVHQESLIADILNAKEIYKTASPTQKKAVLQLLIARIDVSDVDSADIYLNI